LATDLAFLGRGWSFPPSFDRQSREVTMLEGEDDVRSSIEILLSTEIGERVLRPTFGWKRDRWVFESLTATSATAIQKEIEDALTFYEPRIDLNSVRLRPGDPIAGLVEIVVDYTVRNTNTRSNLVFPFYLKEI
jgi:phage baseplate assembly protein W